MTTPDPRPLLERLRRPCLTLFDHSFPVAVGAALAYLIYVRNIVRCRAWPGGDQGNHLMTSLEFIPSDILDTVYLWSNLIYLFLGAERRPGELSVALFLIPLAYFIYQSGRLLGGRAAGALAVFLVCFHGGVHELARTYMLDLPLTCAVAGTLWAMIRSDLFRLRRSSLLLAPVIAAGMLTKYNYFYFILPLVLAGIYLLQLTTRRLWLTTLMLAGAGGFCLIVMSKGVLYGSTAEQGELMIQPALLYALLPFLFVSLGLSRRTGRRSVVVRDEQALARLRNLLLAASVGLLPVLPWYCLHLSRMWVYWFDMNQRVGGISSGGMGQLIVDHFSCWHVGFLPMLILGVVLIPWNAQQRPERAIILLGTISTGAILIMTITPQVRFFIPLLPALVLLSTWWLRLLKSLAWPAAGLVVLLNVYLGILSHDQGLPAGTGDPLISSSLRIPQALPSNEQQEAVTCLAVKNLVKVARILKQEGGPLWLLLCADDQEFYQFRENLALNCTDRRVLAYLMGVRPYSIRFMVLDAKTKEHDGIKMQRVEPGMTVLSASKTDLSARFKAKTGLELRLLQKLQVTPADTAWIYRVGEGTPWLLEPDRHLPLGASPNSPLPPTPDE